MSETLTPGLDPHRPQTRAAGLRRPRVRAGAVLAVAAAAGAGLWLLLGGSSGEKSSPTGAGVPVPISVAGLHTLAQAVPSPIYWLGPMDGVTYELTHTSSDRVFVRYLPAGVAVGADKPYLTVATYPLSAAYAATQRAARQPGAVRVPVAGGAIAFFNRSRPESIYFTEKGSDFQVEVFGPAAARARALVGSNLVQTVVEKSGGASAETASALSGLAASLGHPLYWLGEKPGFKYELTLTSGGKTFIRYLPKGAAVGAATPYLTVATYPFPNAFAAVSKSAQHAGADKIALAGGGLAVVDASYPKSIHLAFPGSDYQVEVFDPSPAHARAVVAAGKVQPVK